MDPLKTDPKKIEEGLRLFLEGAGITDPFVKDLPATVARSWPEEMLSGYSQDPSQILKVEFDAPQDQMVLVRDVKFTSLCCHHLLPFTGSVSLAYLPSRGVTGFSSLGRLVDCYAKRFQTQERMTEQIAQALSECLRPKGVACRVEAEQLCMTARGARKESARVITTAFRGAFAENEPLRQEFLRQAA